MSQPISMTFLCFQATYGPLISSNSAIERSRADVKCQFIRKEVIPEGLHPNKQYKVYNVQQLKKFLGLASYYRRFVPQFARIAEPLHRLKCKHAIFEWSEGCQTAFEELKRKLISPPILAYMELHARKDHNCN